MGPRPDGRGRRLKSGELAHVYYGLQWGRGRMAAEGRACLASSLALLGFNGAAAGWPRKENQLREFRYSVSGFNGAAAGWPRKVRATQSSRASYGRLQWGRGRMAAEGGLVGGSGSGRPGFNGAAAGWPRKAPRGACPAWPAPASMGPRPDGRGRHMKGAGDDEGYEELQWGRGRMAAEGRRRRRRIAGRPELQWGRGRMAAEGRSRELLVKHIVQLQWGRGRMAAEGAPPRNACTRAWCFNGAAAGWPRKAHASATTTAACPASMGPRPDGRGRRRYVEAARAVAELQWGRGRMAAEGPAWAAAPVPAPCASMGPRPDGRGRLNRLHAAVSNLDDASMGPRPDGRGRPPPAHWP